MRIVDNQRVILGPPGCGKTTKLLSLVDDEMTSGVDPTSISYVSFTKRAVKEARTRASEKFAVGDAELANFRTVHSASFALGRHSKQDVLGIVHLKEIGDRLGLEFGNSKWDETTGTYSGNAEGDTHLFIDNLARARCVSLYEQWEACGIPDLDFRAVERTVNSVRKYKEIHGLVDFTDMLERYVTDGKPLNIEVAFVDEAQDLSKLQWRVLQRMLAGAQRVYIAGDDDQAIYRWSGADVSTFLALEGQREVLNQSWRCPAMIHRLSNKISRQIRNRFAKDWAPREERGTINTIHSLEQFDLAGLKGSVMLLARNSYLLSAFYDELRKQGLAYTTSYGTSSVNKTHIRAIQLWEGLRKGKSIGVDDARLVYDHLRVGVGVKRGFKGLSQVGPNARLTLEMLRALYGFIGQDAPWFDVLDAIPGRDIAYYRSVMRRGGNITDEPRIHVNTIHGVKGGEADNVILCPDMAMKSYKEFESNPDDEHRVAYVAVSRTKQNLYLLNPRTRNVYPYIS